MLPLEYLQSQKLVIAEHLVTAKKIRGEIVLPGEKPERVSHNTCQLKRSAMHCRWFMVKT